MRVAVLLALVCLSAGQDDEACVTDAEQNGEVSQRGLLQLKRLREQLSGAAGMDLGDRQSLLEMKAQLASKLDRKEEIKDNERGFLKDFINFIRNTSLKYIRAGSQKDQEEVKTLVNEIEHCDTVVADDIENGEWNAKKQYMLLKKKAHKVCRDEEGDKWLEPNTTCKTLNRWVKGQVDPGVAHGHALPNPATRQEVEAWLRAFWEWHCSEPTKIDDYLEKVEVCTTDMVEANNTHKVCNEHQAEFEKAFCDFKTSVQAGCLQYEVCRTDVDTRYQKTVTRLTIIDKDRKVEWQILHVIICYIELLLGNKAEVTDANKKACETADYPFPADSSVTFPMTEDGVYTIGTNQTECSLTVPEKVVPSPCAQAWVDEHYADIPATAPPAECSYSCSE